MEHLFIIILILLLAFVIVYSQKMKHKLTRQLKTQREELEEKLRALKSQKELDTRRFEEELRDLKSREELRALKSQEELQAYWAQVQEEHKEALWEFANTIHLYASLSKEQAETEEVREYQTRIKSQCEAVLKNIT